ncbi:MAG TPA: DEAD/DEAH box helicase [Candidatus Micrarchaeia archaeon]|nr:DEAD/DEAH box helicase [Candidatus Micrarchaeia archaeon]
MTPGRRTAVPDVAAAPVDGRAADELALADFRATLPFDLDDFQVEAIRALRDHAAVLVSAPTSSGKTVVAEYAVWRALEAPRALGDRRSVIYTTPLKALSNQKFGDLCRRYGEAACGLVTGENTIRPEARVVVMTTEVLRNLIYEDPRRLGGVGTVVLDEIHYIDEYPRGTVWEEVLVQTPPGIQFIGLSATISNVDEVADWLRRERGPVKVVTRSERPVELRIWLGMGSRFYPLFDRHGAVDRTTLERAQEEGREQRRFGQSRALWSAENDLLRVVEQLSHGDLLPAIYFIFSRRGCREAQVRCLGHGLDLTTLDEKHRIDELLTERLAAVDDPDEAQLYLTMLQTRSLRQGIAMHHAGLLPYVKETVETLFQAGLLKVVFATETLALGLNMPARACVVSTFTKFDGQGFSALRSGQLAQLLGRAGRRGIDRLGHGVILRDPDVDLGVIYETVLGDDMAVESKFAPTYNMTLNLLQRHRPEAAEALLLRSFGQYQRERAAHHLVARRANVTGELEDLRRQRFRHPSVPCTERTLTRFQRAGEVTAELRQELRRVRRDHWRDSQRGRGPKAGGAEGSRLERLRREARRLQGELERSPCPRCPLLAEHQGARARIRTLEAAQAEADLAVGERVEAYRHQFRAFRAVLTALGYLADDRPTATGRLAARVYGDNGVLVTEAIVAGWLDPLLPAELAAVVSAVAAEDRDTRRSAPARPRFPTPAVERCWRLLRHAQRRLAELERQHGVQETRPISQDHVGFVYAWAQGTPLTRLQPQAGIDPGDAVRAAKSVYAMLRQLEATLQDRPLQPIAARARQAMERDVIRRL